MASASEPDDLRRALTGQRLPAAFVDLDAFDANAAALLTRAGNRPIRVASKSVRCELLLRRVLDSHPRYRGLMCFTAAEAAWLAGRGFDDLLVAYPTTDDVAIAAVCDHLAAGRRLCLTVDDAAHLDRLAAIAARVGVVLPVSVEFDCSLRLPGLNFGVWRSPLRQPADLLALAQAVADHPHLHLAGLMGYEAQLAGVPDAAAGSRARNVVVRRLKQLSRRVIARRRGALLAALAREDLLPAMVNAGGTGCLEASSTADGVTEVTAGSGLFNPWLFDGYRGFRHCPAAGFALPVVRHPAPGVATCLGGGYPASGGERPAPQPWWPAGGRLSPLEGGGEVQTPVFFAPDAVPAIGEPVLFRHAKAGELCERFDRLLLIQGGRVVDEVPTYRGAGQCFL
ncbi:alanine racemase [Spectribacter hydrogenooxidans]|uniref:Alanine racemase n=1 Tax=Spectribacter hydrogenoxidans TaxID=3075608 RepID=A0ABU3C117_9GAMM|nr:alanine racemase [Salinisphaera sp. W335]MDT0635253.1 alanine racemase [Salinisphaera sp. W335]